MYPDNVLQSFFFQFLFSHPIHIHTFNDYLARRDVQWMGPIYHLLGLSVGLLQQGQDHSYIYDPEHDRGGDDYRQLRPVPRKKAYAAHITYGTNNEFGFDYMRDNMTGNPEELVQRPHNYTIVDEVDSVLIDDARTPHKELRFPRIGRRRGR